MTRSLALGGVLLLASWAGPALGGGEALVWVAARDLPRGALLAEEDLERRPATHGRVPRDAARDLDDIVGMQLRRAVREGRVVRGRALELPSAVKRGQVVRIVVRSEGLEIVGKGRAVSDGAVGERIRVVNIDSRREVSGLVARDGSIHVGL